MSNNPESITEQLIKSRLKYINDLKSELLGPGSEFSIPDPEHELISSRPTQRYCVGILFPKNKTSESKDGEALINEDEEEYEYFSEYTSSDSPDDESHHERNNTDGDVTDEEFDDNINMSKQYMPSSMGITFLVVGDTESIACKISFATYRKAGLEDCIIPPVIREGLIVPIPDCLKEIMHYDNSKNVIRLIKKIERIENNEEFKALDNDFKNRAFRLVHYMRTGYVREPHSFQETLIFDKNGHAEKELKEHNYSVKIFAMRTKIRENTYSITVVIVNESESGTRFDCENCVYQPEMTITSDDNGFKFLSESHNAADDIYADSEDKSLNLLYRNKKNYAIGLGVSTDWKINEAGDGFIKTEYFPITEKPAMKFSMDGNDKITENELSMKYLSDLDESDKKTKLNSMKALVTSYSEWIEKQRKCVENLDEQYREAARSNICNCENAAKRMFEGIETLEKNDEAYNAFLLSNRAMFMQRIHIQKQMSLFKDNANRYPGDPEVSEWIKNIDYRTENDDKCHWRPFQIAFLLMDINSIVNEKCTDRSLVDLIWFPTGGGKTEAYLGLTAFSIFFRKLKYPDNSGGTTVIMRYTLRLLAAQQFTRAATLICACERIRKDCECRISKYPKYKLGKQEITIGLWIGSEHTPNTNKKAKEKVEKLKQSIPSTVEKDKDENNKFQVLKCPWCGTKLVKDSVNGKLQGKWGYYINENNKFRMKCHSCEFNEDLPIQVVDEELYKNPPSLLFGTVDKFAMLAWEPDAGKFFGLDTKTNNRAPELIIQDELHLISGSLGTMVGFYETALDYLCKINKNSGGFFPKIIASTATVRRAGEQVSNLYNRNVVQFPPSGIDAEDSFFAREDEIDYSKGKFGRIYVGYMPSGKTKALTEARTMAALLQKVHSMNLPDEVKDKLWTLTAYFNSIRDLGQADTLLNDDVKDSIKRMASRTFTERRLIKTHDELTSRVQTTELNKTLDKLEKIEYSEENLKNNRTPSSVLLASNMISVGLDVSRLNIMLLVGQPKLTSEYIQASSRVGRTYPGIAFIQYDSTRSRDRSHYEQFKAYHDSFYRYVEPTCVTPFSKPVRDRALDAVVSLLMRHSKKELLKNSDAINFDREKYQNEIQDIEKFIMERISEIIRRTAKNVIDDTDAVKGEMEDFFMFWQDMIETAKIKNIDNVVYGNIVEKKDNKIILFKTYDYKNRDNYARTVMTSMRNVDQTAKGLIITSWDNEDEY